MRADRKKKIKWAFISVSVLWGVSLLFPEATYAWGPGVHVQAGLDVIEKIHLIAPAISNIIANFPYHYLYGCISPDIIIGKKFASEVDHCHNWEVIWRLIEKSDSDGEKAFAYGYMSHLAADVVAHNFFIPNQIIANFIARTLKHTYWEMRYDGLMDDKVWNVFKEIPKEVRDESNKTLKRFLTMTIFSFSTNKRIFNGLMHINRISVWKKMIRNVSKKSQWILSDDDVENYYKLTFQAISDSLRNMEQAQCVMADPNGKESLKTAKKIRSDLRKLQRDGMLTEGDCDRIIKDLKPQFIKKLSTTVQEKHTIKIRRSKTT